MTESDATLVAAATGGDAAAYGRLYDRYARLVRAVCFDATGELAAAQDLCQETFLRAYRMLPRLQRAEKFPAWLLAIARFVCREWRRARRRDRHRFVGLTMEDEKAAPANLPGADPDVHRLLASLPDDQRLALHLFYLQEQPADQARIVLKLSRAGFYKLLGRARQQLAKLLASAEENQS